MGDVVSGARSDKLRLGRARDPVMALGLAVEHLMRKPAYDGLKFTDWSKILAGQINRGHYRFVLDANGLVLGMVGWALTDKAVAEQWVRGAASGEIPGREGNCIIFNVWSADTAEINRVVLGAAREAMRGCETLYFRRFYSDGRTRPVRLSVNQFVGRHLEDHRSTGPGGAQPIGQQASPPKRDNAAGTNATSSPMSESGILEQCTGLAKSKGLRIGRAKSAHVALGFAVDHLMRKPVYARQRFTQWSKVLAGQINRGQYCFVFNRSGRVAGMAGWSVVDRDTAERWARGEPASARKDGNCIFYHVWSAEAGEVNRLLVEAARASGRSCEAAYFRRAYADGRTRPVRIAANRFVSKHLRREAMLAGSQP